jgi:hypothetical protein
MNRGAVMEVEPNVDSCKADVEMVRPLTATTRLQPPLHISAPIAKLELNGYHGLPLLPQTRLAKQEVIENPLSGLSGFKHLISAPVLYRSYVARNWAANYESPRVL